MAITAAEFRGYTRIGPSSYRVTVRFTDAAAPGGFRPDEDFNVTGSTLTEITNDIRRQIAARVAQDAVKDVLEGIPVGTAIAITAPAAAAPSADDVWLSQVAQAARAQALVDAGVLTAPQAATDLAALKTTVNNGYTTARGAKL